MVVNASRRIAPCMMDAGGGARGGPFLGAFPPQDLLAALLSLYIHPIHVGIDTSIHPYIHPSIHTYIHIYNSIYHSYRILALYMGVCMHGDGSEDPLVP